MGADPSDRNDEIWALAQAGQPQAEIAAKFSISRQRVSQIVADRTPAAWGYTDRDRAQIRAKEAAVLERLSREAEKVITSPPLMHSAIGKAIEDPRNPGTYLINESARIGAIRERRPCPTALGEHVPRAARARGIGLVPGGEPDDDPGRD